MYWDTCICIWMWFIVAQENGINKIIQHAIILFSEQVKYTTQNILLLNSITTNLPALFKQVYLHIVLYKHDHTAER